MWYVDSLVDIYFNEKWFYFVCYLVILIYLMFFLSFSVNVWEFVIGKVLNMVDIRMCLLKMYMFIVIIWIFFKLEVFLFI